MFSNYLTRENQIVIFILYTNVLVCNIIKIVTFTSNRFEQENNQLTVTK